MTDGILGLWDGHDAGVAIVADGCLVFALSEERPTRRKRASGWPRFALRRALEWASRHGIAIRDVAVAGRCGRVPLRWLDPIYRRRDPRGNPLSCANRCVEGYENTVAHLAGVREVESRLGLWPVRERLRRCLGGAIRVHAVDHHDAHAFSALFGEIRERALVVTWDAYGEGRALTARLARDPMRVTTAAGPPVGVAALYGAVTVAMGFREGDEGKVMGLAALGEPARAVSRFEDLFEIGADSLPRLRRRLTPRLVERLISGLSREDAAAALQATTRRLVVEAIERLVGGEHTALLLAGGLFANVRLNQALSEIRGVERVFVFPAMGDGGLPAGAAHWLFYQRTRRLADPVVRMALGCEFDRADCEAAIRAFDLAGTTVEDAPRRAADLVVNGAVVGWYDGREEFGPRALGQRSILFRADRLDLAKRVNEALGRDSFMPFAPALVEREAGPAFIGRDPRDFRFMTITAEASRAFRDVCRAAVHVDGTCRPQVVHRAESPRFHRLIEEVRRLGGPVAIVNTSFNRHGEPIVHTPSDAMDTFLRCGLDALFLGDLEVRRPVHVR